MKRWIVSRLIRIDSGLGSELWIQSGGSPRWSFGGSWVIRSMALCFVIAFRILHRSFRSSNFANRPSFARSKMT